ncbi:hypothetical protein HPB49_001500 [Dermacentor silvarum]|uniref:Uncharacterized protein n=1 Tax=Dermacentor silvarum TaxID=543639 RepID=A0ACB8CCX5_DERSI|nr:hypothetical protein HPB49_001500 [Dermacentor silvarum]
MWGYRKEEPRGRKLAGLISTRGITLLTDPVNPTRVGNSVTRDPCPDFTLTKLIRHADCINTEDTLGSDHCILNICTRTLAQAKLPD